MSVISPTASPEAAVPPAQNYVKPSEVFVTPTPTLAETRAITAEPSGGLANFGLAVAVNPEPGLQQLLQVVQAKARLEVTVRLLNAQLHSPSRANAFA